MSRKQTKESKLAYKIIDAILDKERWIILDWGGPWAVERFRIRCKKIIAKVLEKDTK